jgi:dipeptidyl-peptidase 4
VPWFIHGIHGSRGRAAARRQQVKCQQTLDQRNVKELYLLQNAPKNGHRPILHKYRMSFSGDAILPTAELQIIDVQTKSIQLVLTDSLLSPYLSPIELNWVWWSLDNKKIYFIREYRGVKEFTFCEIDAKNGEVEELISEKTESSYVEPSSIAPWKPQILNLEDKKQIIWLSERDGYAHLYLFDQEAKQLTHQITKGEWSVRDVYFYDYQNDWLYYSGCAYDKLKVLILSKYLDVILMAAQCNA